MAGRVGSIKRLMIANRGEIACRIIKTARRMNIETLAIYSAADRNAMHVKMADQAHYIGEAEPQNSYLNQDKIIDTAHRHQVSAIHPGYGFLSESSEFSQRCQKEELVFVGPTAVSIRAMGIKSESKRIMIAAGVPVVPGYHGLDQDDRLLLEEARKIGYPVLIKPVRGGGGKGMRVVAQECDFLEALESSRRESIKSFGDQSMLLEKYIEKPRHIEVQVFGDTQGHYVHLFERDCSVQRRHQKIIEEAPAPLLSEENRQALGQQAVAAAKAVNYVGAGTVEFIMDKNNGEFYFMEMNTRLQVEHPITEMITGTDLVEWQLRVAAGEPLPKSQSEIKIRGHAFEARVYAEDPKNNFLPQTGQLGYLSLPDLANCESAAVRLDTGVVQGDVISPYYDPMIAKLIVWNLNRVEALADLRRALQQYTILGIPTNLDFLLSLASNEFFAAADVGTDFIELHHDELFDMFDHQSYWAKVQQLTPAICASVYQLLKGSLDEPINDDFSMLRMIGTLRPVYRFKVKLAYYDDQSLDVSYQSTGTKVATIKIGLSEKGSSNRQLELKNVQFDILSDHLEVRLNDGCDFYKFGIKSPVITNKQTNETLLVLRNSRGNDVPFRFVSGDVFSSRNTSSSSQDPTLAIAPMPGIVEKVLVSPGDLVKPEQSLMVISAMKMEFTIKSAMEGRIAELRHKVGDFVAKGSTLVRLEKKQE